MKIEIEKNYKLFKTMKGNRPLVNNKVARLVESVQNGLNLFPYCPILVNQEMFIVDGQHRLAACKKLNLPVYYVVVPKITLLQIAQLNAAATRWKASDFFNCFIETGNKDYEVLQLFQTKYGLSVSVATALLMNGSLNGGGGLSQTFKEGRFKVVHQGKAEKIMKAVNDYSPVTDDDVLKDARFIRAIELLLTSELYDHKEIIAKLVTRKSLVQRKLNYKEYIFHIEELFNRGNSVRRIIYDNKKK